jgi:carboxyl-terminal processing protease
MIKNTQTVHERKNNKLVKILVVLALVVSFVCGYFLNYIIQGSTRRNLNAILDLIEEKGIFVTLDTDGEELSDDQLLKVIVKTLLASDPYAKYYSKEEYQERKQQNKGNYEGYGLSFTGTPKIYSVVGNSPAENAGLRSGDVIEKLKADNGNQVIIDSIQTLNTFFSENSNCKVLNVVVDRKGEKKEFNISKKEYVASYVKYFDGETSVNVVTNGSKSCTQEYILEQNYNLPSDTALITLQSFMGDADVQLGYALEYMQQRGKSKLILDLRDNGGGQVEVLCKIANYLIYNGGTRTSPIAYSQGKQKQDVFCTTSNKYNKSLQKTVVLANENTASASECLIGAMLYYGQTSIDDNFNLNHLVISKDSYGNATTYGKGISQTTYRLFSGEAIKFTTAKIYQPDKTTCIHGVGISTVTENQVDNANAVSRAIEIINHG